MSNSDGPQVALIFASTPAERKLVQGWLANDAGANGSADVVDAQDPELGARFAHRSDDPVVTPVQVVWLPPDRCTGGRDGGEGGGGAGRDGRKSGPARRRRVGSVRALDVARLHARRRRRQPRTRARARARARADIPAQSPLLPGPDGAAIRAC